MQCVCVCRGLLVYYLYLFLSTHYLLKAFNNMLTVRDNWGLRVESDDDWHIETTPNSITQSIILVIRDMSLLNVKACRSRALGSRTIAKSPVVYRRRDITAGFLHRVLKDSLPCNIFYIVECHEVG